MQSLIVTITIGLYEARHSIRNRVVFFATVLMTILSMAIGYLGTSKNGVFALAGFDQIIISLVSLSLYIIPLIALALGYDAIIGEKEDKTLDLILTLPVSRLQLFVGKFLGFGVVLAFSIFLGFMITGMIIGATVGFEQFNHYLLFITNTILLGLSFLAISMLISAFAKSRPLAIGASIVIWFFFVFIYDMVLIGALLASDGMISPQLFSVSLFFNPADVNRILTLTHLDSAKIAYGLITLTEEENLSQISIYIASLVWIIAPTSLGALIFKKDI